MFAKIIDFFHRLDEVFPGWPWLLVDWTGSLVTSTLPEGSWLIVPSEVITYTGMLLFFAGVWGVEVHVRVFRIYVGVRQAMPYISREAPGESD